MFLSFQTALHSTSSDKERWQSYHSCFAARRSLPGRSFPSRNQNTHSAWWPGHIVHVLNSCSDILQNTYQLSQVFKHKHVNSCKTVYELCLNILNFYKAHKFHIQQQYNDDNDDNNNNTTILIYWQVFQTAWVSLQMINHCGLCCCKIWQKQWWQPKL